MEGPINIQLLQVEYVLGCAGFPHKESDKFAHREKN